MAEIQIVNEELQKEIKESTEQNIKSIAAYTKVFKDVVNAKKKKIRSLAADITE